MLSTDICKNYNKSKNIRIYWTKTQEWCRIVFEIKMLRISHKIGLRVWNIRSFPNGRYL